MVFSLVRDGGYAAHCDRLRALLSKNREPAISLLREAGLTVQAGGAGMYLWGQLPETMDALALATDMAHQGHVLAPGRLFSPMQEYRRHLRFNVAETARDAALARELANQVHHACNTHNGIARGKGVPPWHGS